MEDSWLRNISFLIERIRLELEGVAVNIVRKDFDFFSSSSSSINLIPLCLLGDQVFVKQKRSLINVRDDERNLQTGSANIQ